MLLIWVNLNLPELKKHGNVSSLQLASNVMDLVSKCFLEITLYTSSLFMTTESVAVCVKLSSESWAFSITLQWKLFNDHLLQDNHSSMTTNTESAQANTNTIFTV